MRWWPGLAALGLLLLPRCILDTSGLGPAAGGGGAGAGGDEQPSCVPACEPPGDCYRSLCVDGACEDTLAPRGAPCSENGGEVCDGEGLCVGTLGAMCEEADACVSGICADGVCCDTPCSQTCHTCAPDGACMPLPSGSMSDDCVAGVCDGIGSCAVGVVQWAFGAGDITMDRVSAVAAEPTGAGWAALQFDGSVMVDGMTYSSGISDDVLLVRFADNGDIDRVVPLTGAGDQAVTDMAYSNGVLYVAGVYETELVVPGETKLDASVLDSDAFVLALNVDGTSRWLTAIAGGGPETVSGLAPTPDGVVAGGLFGDELKLGSGSFTTGSFDTDGFVARFDGQTGAVMWAIEIGSADREGVGDVAVRDGEVVVVGSFDGVLSLPTQIQSNGDRDVFVARLGLANGVAKEAFSFGSPAAQTGDKLALLPDDRVAVAGTYLAALGSNDLGVGDPIDSAGSTDVFLAVFEKNGTLVDRVFALGTGLQDDVADLKVDLAGNLVAALTIRGSVDFGEGAQGGDTSGTIFAVKHTAEGQLLWSRAWGDMFTDRAEALSLAPDGAVWLGGSFSGTLAAGNAMVGSAGSLDGVVMKLTQ